MTGTAAETGYRKGLLAEKRAALYFRLRGYGLLAERFRTPVGEIDLILLRGNTVVFVEVKLRRTVSEAAEAIHARNQSRVRQAAELYLQQHPEYTGHDIRFDALVMGRMGGVEHLENAY